MKDNKELSHYYIGATYIGTVVGAGFASGQEVLQFFGYFGLKGIIGLILTTILLALFGYMVLELGRRLRAESHLPVIQYAGGKWIGTVIDWVITFFLFGGLVTMAAGAGAIFIEQFNLPFLLGSLLIVVASVLTVFLGISGVIASISFAVPLLLAAVFGVTIYTIITDYNSLLAVLRSYSNVTAAPVPYWPLTAILYTSYNLILSVAILAPMGNMSSQKKVLKGAVLGGVGLGIGALAINLAILTKIGSSSLYEVPMIFVAGSISPIAGTGYTIVLLTEVYTTAISSLYGFTARLTKEGTARYRWTAIATGVAAFGMAQFGFSNLVGILYPAVGFAGLLLLGSMAYRFLIQNIEKIAEPSMAFKLSKKMFDKNKDTSQEKDKNK